MKKAIWLMSSICLLSLAAANVMADEDTYVPPSAVSDNTDKSDADYSSSNSSPGEDRYVPPSSVSDNTDKQVVDPVYSQRIEPWDDKQQ